MDDILILKISDEEEPRSTFHEINLENGKEFQRDFGPNGILYRHQRIHLNSTDISPNELQEILFTHDIDGVSIATHKFQNVTLPVYSIRLGNGVSMTNRIKKHFDAKQLDTSTARGIRLTESNGYSLMILIAAQSKQNLTKEDVIIKENEIRNCLKKAFLSPTTEAFQRYSFRTNDLSQIGSYFKVSETDQHFIKLYLDTYIQKDPKFLITPFISKFGQKSQEVLKLQDIVCTFTSCVVHIGSSITTPEASLFWSRQSVQELVRGKGMLYKCLTLRECCNYQSIPGFAPNIHHDLQAIAAYPSDIAFVQLYSETPHVKVPYRHPVSATLLSETWHHNVSILDLKLLFF